MTIPSDYDKDDGWNEQNGLEECPHCGKQLGGETGHHGEVYDANGRRYDHLLNTEPGNGPFFCPECWPELKANKNAQEHKTLDKY